MISAKIGNIESISANLEHNEKIVVGLGSIEISSYPEYTGEYVVTPKAEEATILPTKKKSLLHNIIVEEIPYYSTSNKSGTTFIIG